jgi:hypothetical protein
METVTDEYMFLALACLAIALVMLRLLVRERVTLQGSMSFAAFLLIIGALAIAPSITMRIAHALGFTLMSNFLFCTAIAALAILHLRSQVTISKVQLRSVALTQELALLQEKLDRVVEADQNRLSVVRATPSAR